MKIVINRCYGGFSLSPAAVKKMAEKNGRECYFFKNDYPSDSWVPLEEIKDRSLFWSAFDIPNPNEILTRSKDWGSMSLKERTKHNELHRKHSLEMRPDKRSDPVLIQVVEEL